MAQLRSQNLSFFAAPPPPPTNAQPDPNIIESTNIKDLLKFCAPGKTLVLDLDNTVIEPEDHHDELGSDQWFVAFLSHAKSLPLEENLDAAVFVIAIYHAVQHHVQLKLIQPDEIKEVMKAYLDLGNHVLFLTARGSAIREPTLRQLRRNGIDLSTHWGAEAIVLDIGDGDIEHAPVFKSGGIFCGGKPKELCLKTFMSMLEKVLDVVMADDKEKYLKAVIKMVQEHGGTAVGLRYGRLDEKVKQHDFPKAQRRLDELSPHLAPEAQEAMAVLGLKM